MTYQNRPLSHWLLIGSAWRRLLSYAEKSPFSVVLSKKQRTVMEGQVRQYTSSYCNVIGAKIVLLAAEASQRRHRCWTHSVRAAPASGRCVRSLRGK